MNIILTGGHSGIGLELTKMLLNDNHKIGLILRSEKRKSEFIQAFGESSNVDFFFADLSNQQEVEQVAMNIRAKWSNLDGLFNNAGVLNDKAYYSPQNNELHFEVNTLAPYILTLALRPLLEKSEHPFIVNTVTGGMHKQKSLDVAQLKKPEKFVKLFGSYMNSKFALVVLMNHLANQYPNLRIVNVDPGPNKTKMTNGDGMPKWLLLVRNLMFPETHKRGLEIV